MMVDMVMMVIEINDTTYLNCQVLSEELNWIVPLVVVPLVVIVVE
jgi:hypothetical protein